MLILAFFIKNNINTLHCGADPLDTETLGSKGIDPFIEQGVSQDLNNSAKNTAEKNPDKPSVKSSIDGIQKIVDIDAKNGHLSKLVQVCGGNINVNSLNVNFANPSVGYIDKRVGMGMGMSGYSDIFANIGIGVAIAGGMTAAAFTLKASALAPGAKIGATIAGGIAASTIFIGANAANGFLYNKINKDIKNNTKAGVSSHISENPGDNSNLPKNFNCEPFTCKNHKPSTVNTGNIINAEKAENLGNSGDTKNTGKEIHFNNASISEPKDLEMDPVNDVFTFLSANYILHISILCLVLCLGLIYIINYVIKKDFKLYFIKKFFGEKFYVIFIKILKITSRTNEI